MEGAAVSERVFQVLRWKKLFGGTGQYGLAQEYSIPFGPEHDTEEAAREYIDNLPPLEGRFTVQRVLPARPDPNWPANRPRRPHSDRSDTEPYPAHSDVLDPPDGLI